MSMNSILLIGRLGRDPDIKSYADGTRYARLSLATSESWKDKKTGEKRERTEWHQAVIFTQSTVDYVERWICKGSLIRITGKIETRSWDENGSKRYITEVMVRPFQGEVSLLRDGRGRGETLFDPNAPSGDHMSYRRASGAR